MNLACDPGPCRGECRMLDLKALEKDPEGFEKRLGRRGLVPGLSELLELSQERKSLFSTMQVQQEHGNAASKALSQGSKDEIEKQRASLRDLAQSIKEKEAQLKEVEHKLEAIALVLPNVPRDDVPSGESEDDNVVVRTVLEPRVFDFSVRDHVD